MTSRDDFLTAGADLDAAAGAIDARSMSAGVRSAHVRAHLRGLAAAGLPAESLARAAGVDLAALDDPERWVPASAIHALWEAARRLDPSPDLGLRVGASVPAGALDVLDYLLPSCATLRDALVMVDRLHRIATTTSQFRVVDAPGGGDVRLESELRVPGVRIHPLGRDYVFAVIVLRLRRLDARMRPRVVELRGPALAPAGRYLEIFGVPATFDHAASALVFSPDVLDLPMSSADASLCAILERHAQTLAAKAPSADLLDRARTELARMIGEGRLDVATLGKRLGTSPRTLQRRLVERGVAYSTLLDEARCELACAHLRDATLSIDEIAGLLGYSEPSAFSRAFRRWTGSAPARYRKGIARRDPDERDTVSRSDAPRLLDGEP